MPDVKIKGYSGTELPFSDVPKVWLAAPDSTAEDPVLVPFTYGEAIEGVEVEPDFSAGDMQITAPDGYLIRSGVVKKPETLVPENIRKNETVAGIKGEYEGTVPETEEKIISADFSGGDMVVTPTDGAMFSKVTIQKPETLVPGNIAEGVDIAGIIGTLAGGSNVKFFIKTIAYTSVSATHSHDLGVIPDIVIHIANPVSLTVKTVRYLVFFGTSQAMNNKYPSLPKKAYALNSNSNKPTVMSLDRTIEEKDSVYVNAVTDTSISVAGGTVDGTLIAIAGLT